MSKDPLRFDATGTNLYAYALSDPVNYVDRDGRFAFPLAACAFGGCEAIVAGAGWLAVAVGSAIVAIIATDAVANNPDILCPIGGEGKELDQIAKDTGISRDALRKALEKIKKAAGLRGNENVDILPNGTVVDPVSGDPLGNIHDEQGD